MKKSTSKKFFYIFKHLSSKLFVFFGLTLALAVSVFATHSIVNYMSSASSRKTPHPWNEAWVYEQRWWIGSDCESGVLVNSKQSGPYSGPITDTQCGDTVWEGNNTKSNVRSFKVNDCSEYSSGYCTSGCKYFDSCSKCAPPDKTEAEVCSTEPPPVVVPPPIVPGTSCTQGSTSCQQNNGVNTGYQCNCVAVSSSENVWQCNNLNTTACPTGSSGGGTPPATSGCRQFDGNASACGGDCAYYTCSSQCHPRGTSNCDAGCSGQCGGNSGGGGQGGGSEDTSSPKGYLDIITANKEVVGWTCDPDDFQQPLAVHFYIDSGAGEGGTFIGSTIASMEREVAVGTECGGRSASGYVFSIPEQFHIGTISKRSIYAYGINIGQGSNKLLTNSGQTFDVTPPEPSFCTSMSGTLKTAGAVAKETDVLNYSLAFSSSTMIKSVDLTINPTYAGNNGWVQYAKLLPPFPTNSSSGVVTFKQLRDKIIAAGQHTNIVQINTEGIMVVANVVQLDGSFCDGGGKWNGGPKHGQPCTNNCVTIVKLAPPVTPNSFKVIFNPQTNKATISLYGHESRHGVINYRIERCSGEGCTNFTHLTTLTNVPSKLLTYDAAVPTGQVHRYRLRAWDGSTYSQYTPILNSTISWVFIGQPVCENGTTPTAKTKMSYALWPPNPLKWVDTSYLSGNHTISVLASNSWNYGYVLLRLSNAALVPIGTPEHPKITYGTSFDWPMARIDRELPSGTYTIKYRAPQSLCGFVVPPLPVKDFTADLRSNRTVKMSWSNQPNAIAHRIEWCAGAGCTDFKSLSLLHTHKTTYTTPFIPQTQTHTFRVRTFNGKEFGPAIIRSFP